MKTLSVILFSLVLTIGQNADAQDSDAIEDFTFLIGYWEGTGFGGISEEIWMPPRDGRMFGIFKQSSESGLEFTEFLEIARDKNQDGNFVLRLRHFSEDFTAWEDKEEYVTFPLQSVSENRIEFEGLAYELISQDELEITLTIQHSDGSQSVEKFNLRRKALK